MTDFVELFKKAHYGSYGDTYQHDIRVHLTDPETVYDESRLKMYDDWTAQSIQEIEGMLTILKDYRKILVQRYSELATSATVPVIRLRRHKDWWKDHKVFYYLEEITRYVDKPDNKAKTDYTDKVINKTEYPGTERRKAIADYNAYIKSHPGIIAEKDIEKGKWER